MAKTNRRRNEERRSAAAAKVAEMRRQQEAAARRRRTLLISGIVLVVVAVIVVIAVVVATNKSTSVASGKVRGATPDYGFVVGKPGAPASMVVYEDFQCPVCKSFEAADGDVIKQKVADGTLKVEYRPIAFLDHASTTNYSTRSLNAAACVSNYSSIEAWKKFHDLLFATQPAEGSAGLTDEQLTALAKQAGATSPDVGSCISDQTFKEWTVSATNAASKANVTGTPTIRLNGKDVPLSEVADPTNFAKIIDAAAQGS